MGTCDKLDPRTALRLSPAPYEEVIIDIVALVQFPLLLPRGPVFFASFLGDADKKTRPSSRVGERNIGVQAAVDRPAVHIMCKLHVYSCKPRLVSDILR